MVERAATRPALTRLHSCVRSALGTLTVLQPAEEDGDDVWTGTSWRPGAASRLWAHHALQSMSDDLALRYGDAARIVYAHGPAAAALQSLCAAVRAALVVANRRHEPAMVAADAATTAALLTADIQVPCPHPRTIIGLLYFASQSAC